MKKEKEYRHVRFSADVIKAATRKLDETITEFGKKEVSFYLTINLGSEVWLHDTESEFFADYHRSPIDAHYRRDVGYEHGLRVNSWEGYMSRGKLRRNAHRLNTPHHTAV